MGPRCQNTLVCHWRALPLARRHKRGSLPAWSLALCLLLVTSSLHIAGVQAPQSMRFLAFGGPLQRVLPLRVPVPQSLPDLAWHWSLQLDLVLVLPIWVHVRSGGSQHAAVTVVDTK